MKPMRPLFLTALALLACAAACSSPDPVLYTIAPVNGAVQSVGPRVVLLDRIEIARYLDRSQIVQSSESYRFDIKSNDWWGEPLGAMLRRILQQELSQRLPQSAVLNALGAVSESADATIDLDFHRLDEDAAGNVVLQAQASITFKGHSTPVLRSFNLTARPTAAGTPGEVAAISGVVGQLADGLAAMLAGR
jgi:uncharacterized protein